MKFLLFFFLMVYTTYSTVMKKHPADIYLQGSNNQVFSPFKLVIDPMDRLLLVNFEKDPDTVYMGFEPQVFDDDINGKGMLVIGWRVDGRVDVYHQPGLQLDKSKYDIAGKGLANMASRPMADAYFRIGDKGIDMHIAFEDLLGRKVKIEIHENHPKKRKPFGLLAPMGQAAERPSAMPLVLLHDFYFVRKKHTLINIQIDNKSHTPDPLPLPLDWMSMYMTRYSPDPLILTLNPAQNAPLEAIEFQDGIRVNLKNNQYEFALNADKLEIANINALHLHHQVRMNFSPAFPQINMLKDGANVSGKFTLTGHLSTGKITGEYYVSKAGELIRIRLAPTGGWQPNEKKWSLRFLYFVAKIFKNWPKTYLWKGEVSPTEEGMKMESKWERLM
jgi:hypothetical protein